MRRRKASSRSSVQQARLAVFALIVVALFGSGHRPAARQERVLVPEEVACPECAIRLEPEVLLGDPSGQGMLESDNNRLSRDSRGRYYVSSGAPYFWVFDPSGTVLRRVGREGQGPGEFRGIGSLLVGEEDRLHAFDFDYGQRRVSTFTSDYELAGTAPIVIARFNGAIVIGDLFVANGMARFQVEEQAPLHVVDSEGAIVRSFGAETGEYRTSLPETWEMRELAPAGEDGVWAAPVNQYLIERWSLDGRLTDVVRREVDWFEPWWVIDFGLGRPPQPLITAISQQGDILWVMVRIPDPEWRTVQQPSGRFFTVLDRHKYVDTVIEAIDLSAGRVIASTRFDRALRGFVGEGMVYGQGMGAEGDESVAVFRFSLDGG